jgi:hypothetical protein
MKPSQKELNDFVLDLVEFMGKHFPSRFDKTRVAGGNEGVSIRIRRAESASELEIATDRLDPVFTFGPALWRFRESLSDKDVLFERMLSDLTAVFLDRMVSVQGFRGEAAAPGMVFRGIDDEAAVRLYRGSHPGCERIAVKRWTHAERSERSEGSEGSEGIPPT